MNSRDHGMSVVDLDGLRLVAFGRIPRCKDCPRYMALVERHYESRRVVGSWPAVPASCTHEVCAPLVARFSANPRESDEPRLLRVVGGNEIDRSNWARH